MCMVVPPASAALWPLQVQGAGMQAFRTVQPKLATVLHILLKLLVLGQNLKRNKQSRHGEPALSAQLSSSQKTT